MSVADCFIEYYRRLERVSYLKHEDFIEDREAQQSAKDAIRGMAGCLKEMGKRIGVVEENARGFALGLVMAGAISATTADDLSELLEYAGSADSLDPEIIYANLVRFMEVFEEAYVGIRMAEKGSSSSA